MVRIHESCPKVIVEISVGVFFHIPSSFCEDLSESFLFVFISNKKLIYLLRNMERNAWSTKIGPGKDTPNGPRNDIFH
jgi:hypothetical protein